MNSQNRKLWSSSTVLIHEKVLLLEFWQKQKDPLCQSGGVFQWSSSCLKQFIPSGSQDVFSNFSFRFTFSFLRSFFRSPSSCSPSFRFFFPLILILVFLLLFFASRNSTFSSFSSSSSSTSGDSLSLLCFRFRFQLLISSIAILCVKRKTREWIGWSSEKEKKNWRIVEKKVEHEEAGHKTTRLISLLRSFFFTFTGISISRWCKREEWIARDFWITDSRNLSQNPWPLFFHCLFLFHHIYRRCVCVCVVHALTLWSSEKGKKILCPERKFLPPLF